MAKIIKFKQKSQFPPDNLIVSRPFDFRSADWDTTHFIQMKKSHSFKLEQYRKELYEKERGTVLHLPPHHTLRGAMASTIRAMYLNRLNEERMREIYYLAGLVDCMINRINPLLRTDLVRDVYRKIMTLKEILSVNWYRSMNQVLFPLDSRYFNESEYKGVISRAGSLRELYATIREKTDEMFDILSRQYVFYTPGIEA